MHIDRASDSMRLLLCAAKGTASETDAETRQAFKLRKCALPEHGKPYTCQAGRAVPRNSFGPA